MLARLRLLPTGAILIAPWMRPDSAVHAAGKRRSPERMHRATDPLHQQAGNQQQDHHHNHPLRAIAESPILATRGSSRPAANPAQCRSWLTAFRRRTFANHPESLALD